MHMVDTCPACIVEIGPLVVGLSAAQEDATTHTIYLFQSQPTLPRCLYSRHHAATVTLRIWQGGTKGIHPGTCCFNASNSAFLASSSIVWACQCVTLDTDSVTETQLVGPGRYQKDCQHPACLKVALESHVKYWCNQGLGPYIWNTGATEASVPHGGRLNHLQS